MTDQAFRIHRAYVVLIIRRGTPSVVIGAGVFGEEHPTMPHVTVPIGEFKGADFDGAAKAAGAYLSSSHLDWCGELKISPTRGAYREAPALVSGTVTVPAGTGVVVEVQP